ncbi:taste receptor type 1 member 2.2 [Astatotilapia calliptera]|uniref:taste receptor type 1 member 2.2 n=1 Tax=Astatotilapia calliptera TaxID=8154 RepID=UPI0003296B44|nr:taste receptor type 1 member 1-like [Maylandia zebra]XP_026009273.1 taste receptor type 1 member 1-like [Astatotilapia calliptera]
MTGGDRAFLHVCTQHTVPASEFQLEGDYLIGGLFHIHDDTGSVYHERPEALDCTTKPLTFSNYRRFQMIRFSVEQVNNSTNLLPNVSLGYDIFDHCSDTQNFPGVLKLISANGSIQPWSDKQSVLSKVIAVVGPFTSTQSLTVAPLLMVNLVPMVNYATSTSVFSNKAKYPSFLRTLPSNLNMIDVIVRILQKFNWRWVAFLNSDDDYGNDGLNLFTQRIKDTEICLPYSKGLSDSTNYTQTFKQMEAKQINVIIVFALENNVEPLIESAMLLNVTNKVWIAGDAWALNKKLPKMKGIKNIGTVLGVAEPVVTIPGFSDFLHSSKAQLHCKYAEQDTFCNQKCNCSCMNPEDIFAADPSYSFAIYSAIYAIAHALHNTLRCGADKCDSNITVYPYIVLAELRKSNFTLVNNSIQFDDNGNLKQGSYSVVFWNNSGDAQEIGFYQFNSEVHFFVDDSKIEWHTNGEVPTSLCSPECPAGYIKKRNGIYECCFDCEICANGTYVNITESPYTCLKCKDIEWSEEGSTSCNLRAVEYISATDIVATLVFVAACAFVGMTLAMSVLFSVNYNTPVVRSAGGPMCFLILGCLSLSNLSVFFHFGKPTVPLCTLRYLPFLLFYTICLACFVVRSFQIVCIFKIAAKIPKLHSWWVKYNGQWLVIVVAFVIQAIFLVIGYSCKPPSPYNETSWYPDKIILSCDISLQASTASVILLLSICTLCFIFSYMGKNLPKNYNEAKAITFCLLLLILTWIIFATECMLYRGKYIQLLSALAVLSSLYSFLFWYFLPKCFIILFQPHKNTQQYFQGLIQNYTKTISQ